MTADDYQMQQNDILLDAKGKLHDLADVQDRNYKKMTPFHQDELTMRPDEKILSLPVTWNCHTHQFKNIYYSEDMDIIAIFRDIHKQIFVIDASTLKVMTESNVPKEISMDISTLLIILLSLILIIAIHIYI